MSSGKRHPSLKLPGHKKPVSLTGLDLVDQLADRDRIVLHDYVAAVSEYVRKSAELSAGTKKAAQLRLVLRLPGRGHLPA